MCLTLYLTRQAIHPLPEARNATISPKRYVATAFRRAPTQIGTCQVRRSNGSINDMLRPGSCVRPAGVSPVPVGAGAPGSRPQFVIERWRAERGVESLFGGSKCAGRSVKRTLQPRHIYNGRAEPLMSRRRSRLSSLVPGGMVGLLGVGTAARAQGLARNRRDPSAHACVRQETRGISQW